jgi:hypothetical protein
MNAESELRTASFISGNMIDLGEGHSIAIYERNGECHVAEFREGCGSLEYASSWFRFQAGALRWGKGRAALQSSMPLNPEMLEKIERLHAVSDARQARLLAVPVSVAAAARRYWINAISRLRGRAARISQPLG